MKNTVGGVGNFIKAARSSVVAEPSFNRAIHIARFFGEVLWKNATGCYQLAALERTLVDRIGHSTDHSRRCRFGRVLTKAYDTGGHTRGVERLVVCEISFFERMWLSKRLPTVPVYGAPTLSLILPLLMLKWRGNG